MIVYLQTVNPTCELGKYSMCYVTTSAIRCSFLYQLIQATMKTILLIEDNISILENLTEYLEMEGYKTLPAHDGINGIELARKFIPDLIICDVLMPEIDGFEVLRLLLNRVQTSEIPFIFSSSMSEKIDKTEAIKLGADDYITKPFELEILLRMAKTWIKSGSKRRSGYIENVIA